MKSCLYFSLVSSVMFYGLAYGACTPSPDCASLGYTATSCPNGGVKCPFDTSKWRCDKSCEDFGFIYTCEGNAIASGMGISCNGKYASCQCAFGYFWGDGGCWQAYEYDCCNTTKCSYDSCMKYGAKISCGDKNGPTAKCSRRGGKSSFYKCYSTQGSYVAATYICEFY